MRILHSVVAVVGEMINLEVGREIYRDGILAPVPGPVGYPRITTATGTYVFRFARGFIYTVRDIPGLEATIRELLSRMIVPAQNIMSTCAQYPCVAESVCESDANTMRVFRTSLSPGSTLVSKYRYVWHIHHMRGLRFYPYRGTHLPALISQHICGIILDDDGLCMAERPILQPTDIRGHEYCDFSRIAVISAVEHPMIYVLSAYWARQPLASMRNTRRVSCPPYPDVPVLHRPLVASPAEICPQYGTTPCDTCISCGTPLYGRIYIYGYGEVYMPLCAPCQLHSYYPDILARCTTRIYTYQYGAMPAVVCDVMHIADLAVEYYQCADRVYVLESLCDILVRGGFTQPIFGAKKIQEAVIL